VTERSDTSVPKPNAVTLERFACPACFGELRRSGNVGISCNACRRTYPLIDGIPVLIAERATLPVA
jgi:uncharacterized protein YbaR (Trm112 family)